MSQVQQSYDRICNLRVFQREELPAGPNGMTLGNIDNKGKVFSSKQPDGGIGFRIKFHVEKVTGPVPVPNPSTIQIYNLGPNSRAFVSKLNDLVVLEAGYGKNPKTIFSGNISKAITRKEGSDYVTELQAAEGLYAFQNSLINMSTSVSTPASTVVNTLLGALKGCGIQPGLVSGVPNTNYNQGIVLSGSAIKKLKDVCNSLGLDFTIENGESIVLPYGQAKPTPPIPITRLNGLVGIPEVREQDITGKRSLITFKTLLNPALTAFQSVFLTSKFVNGFYTIAKTTHTGDTFSLEWYTTCEAT